MNLIEYLESKGLKKIKKEDHNFVMSPCPHCDKESTMQDRHFFVSTNGYAHCFSCGGKGNIYTYKKIFNDETIVQNSPPVKHFKNKKGKVVASWTGGKRHQSFNSDMVLPEDFAMLAYEYYISDSNKAKEARNYLESIRNFDWEILEEFQVGLTIRGTCENKYLDDDNPNKCDFRGVPQKKKCPKCGGKLRKKSYFLTFPYFTKSGKLFLVKYRSLPPEKQFEREVGGKTHLFGLQNFDRTKKSAMIVEAELDAIAAYQLGFNNVVSISGSKNWKSEFIEYFENCSTVYVALDNDEAGDKATQQIIDSLGGFRCKVVEWPSDIKDASEYLEKGATQENFKELLSSAIKAGKKVWLKGYDFKSTVEKLLSRGDDLKGIPTHLSALNELLGGIRSGEVTIVTSDTGQGKSLLTSELLLRLAERDVPSAVASFELTLDDIAIRTLTQITRIPFWELKEDIAKLENALHTLEEIPFFSINLFGEIELDTLKQIIKFGLRKYGLKAIVLDHLHYFLIGSSSKNARFIIDQTLRTISQWAREWDIHIFLVVHPSKVGGNLKERKSGIRIDPDMLKGSSGIKQEAHNVIGIYRARGYESVMIEEGNIIDSASELTVYKCRSTFGSEGIRWLNFNKQTLSYSSMSLEEGYNADEVDKEGLKDRKSKKKKSKEPDEEFEPEYESGTDTGSIFNI